MRRSPQNRGVTAVVDMVIVDPPDVMVNSDMFSIELFRNGEWHLWCRVNFTVTADSLMRTGNRPAGLKYRLVNKHGLVIRTYPPRGESCEWNREGF